MSKMLYIFERGVSKVQVRPYKSELPLGKKKTQLTQNL